MTTSQFFVYRRPIAWAALFATLAWGAFAYMRMPQRHDPGIIIGTAVVVTPYPGASAETVEQEVTRKVERTVTENSSIKTVSSLSRDGLSVVYVETFESVKDTDAQLVWDDLRGRLAAMRDLPQVAGQTLSPRLNKDFGQTVAMMLTISSPPVGDLEINLRAQSIREALEQYRGQLPTDQQTGRWAGVLVYPNTVARSFVLRIGRTLLQRLAEDGLIEQGGRIIEAPGTGCIDFRLASGKSRADLLGAFAQWRREQISGEVHPDIWEGFFIDDLARLPQELRAAAKDKYTYRELRDFADLIRDRLKQSPNIARIEQLGAQEEQITLYYSGQRFQQYGISPAQVVQKLRQRNTNLPGGRVELPDQNIIVRPTGKFSSEREISEVVMGVSQEYGYPLYLRDMVEIVRGYQDPPAVMNFRTAQTTGTDRFGDSVSDLQTTRAITLAIEQVKDTKVAEFGRDVDRTLEDLKSVLPSDLTIARASNEPADVQRKIHEFDMSLIEAVIIVILVCLVFMEWRSAAMVAISIPLTVAMTLGLCELAGVDLQQVSIAALIIALGLLVDDPVVAADAINREMAAGVRRDVASWLGPQKLARAILFATLTNIVAFLPLLLVTGRTGDFIWSLPIVVTASLIASRVVSMTFVPLLGSYFLRGQRGLEAGTGSRIARGYSALANWTLAHKAVTLAFFAILLGAGVYGARKIGTSFFPKDLHSTFVVNVFMPESTPIRQTRDEAKRIIGRIHKLEGTRIESYTTFVGAGGPRFWISVVPEQRADNYAQILVHSRDREETQSIVRRLKEGLPPLVADARVTIEQLETGPPVGVPVQLRIYGPRIEQLRSLAASVKSQLRQIPGATNIHDDWDPEVFQIPLTINSDRANLSGLSNEDVATMVGTGLSGMSATEMRQGNRDIPIVLRLRPGERSQVADLFNLYAIGVQSGARAPLRQLIDIRTPELSTPKIRRREHERCITVRCDVTGGVLASDVIRQLQPRLGQVPRSAEYRFEFGGEQEEQAKGFASVRNALIVSLLAIYLALVLQFNSLTQPLVVFAAVPFGMVGGLMGLLIFDAPFGFMAFLGIASLAGVIVSHVIVLFDYIDEMRKEGAPLRKAVVDAALVRLRPVLVTVLATVGGLVPLAIRGGPLWEPMCYVLIVGLLVATVVTLLIVPALYVAFVEKLKLIRWRPAGEIDGPPVARPVPAVAAAPAIAEPADEPILPHEPILPIPAMSPIQTELSAGLMVPQPEPIVYTTHGVVLRDVQEPEPAADEAEEPAEPVRRKRRARKPAIRSEPITLNPSADGTIDFGPR